MEKPAGMRDRSFISKVCLLAVMAGGSRAMTTQSEYRSPATQSLQINHDVRTVDETYVITPPFTEFVVPIALPFTPDPEAFQSMLFPPVCG
jgi:hypothetical protein